MFGLLALACTACGKSRKQAPAIPWFDIDFAPRQAARNHRPLFLYFGASWDCASKELEHQTFPEPELATLMCEDFVCARVDCSDDEDPKTMELVRRYDVKGTPTLLVMHPVRNVELWRATEYVKPEPLGVALRAARARLRRPRARSPWLDWFRHRPD
jgi:thiol:disulfide interchange protein